MAEIDLGAFRAQRLAAARRAARAERNFKAAVWLLVVFMFTMLGLAAWSAFGPVPAVQPTMGDQN